LLGVRRNSKPLKPPLPPPPPPLNPPPPAPLRGWLKRWLRCWRLLASLLVGDRRPDDDGGADDASGWVNDARSRSKWSKFGGGSLGGEGGSGCLE
jgi:hypothetical protein